MNKIFKHLILVSLLLAFTVVGAQNNPELQKIADQDQEARMSSEPLNWKTLRKEDSLRRVKVIELLKNKEIKTGVDYLNAGIVFQHGTDSVASKMAVKFFKKAIELDSTVNKWWYAAAVDRDLMRRGEPQIYGTQYTVIKDDLGNPTPIQYEIDTTQISDKERKYYGVPSLAEQKERNHYLGLKKIGQFYANTNSIDQTIDLIKSEFEKGDQAGYDVRENTINMFGYALMNTNQNEEALRIFKLNTELFPESANTYDSYGECLIKVGETKKGKDAYRKSLELDPDNERARNVLSEG